MYVFMYDDIGIFIRILKILKKKKRNIKMVWMKNNISKFLYVLFLMNY